MFNKKRLFVAGAFIIALLFMTMYAGGSGEQETTAMRIVKFIDGFNNAEISSQNIEVGKEANVPDSPTHRNLLFIGWYDGDTRVTKFENIMEDLTVKSQYVDDINNNEIDDSVDTYYTVTFYDTITESNIRTVEVLTGMNAVAPTPRVHDGLTFTGWSRGFTNVASDLTVNARYRTTEELESDVVNTYTVRFLVGDEEISTQTIEDGAAATAPEEREIDKKVFTGWDTSFDKVTTDLTVKAVYADDINENRLDDSTETRYTVTFVAGTGGTLDGNTEFTNLLINLSLEDNGVTIPEPIEEDGYEFNGWNVELTSETKVAGNTTYTANFKDIEKPRVEIKNVNEYNPKSFDIIAGDNLSGLVRIDYSLWINNNTDRLGVWGKDISGTSYNELNIDKYRVGSSGKVYKALTELDDGIYTIRATVKDAAGNKVDAINVNFEVDKTNASFSITSPENNSIVTETQRINAVIADKNDITKVLMNVPGDKTYTYEKGKANSSLNRDGDNFYIDLDTTMIPDGLTHITLIATDGASNTSHWNNNEETREHGFIVDNNGPSKPTITADDDYKAGVWVNKDVTLRFASTDNITTTENLRYVTHNSNEKDVTKWTNIENPNTYKTNTNKNVYVRAVDEAGNYSEPSEFFQVKVDITNPKTPEVNMNDYVEGISTKNKVTLKAYGSEEQNNDGVQITTESLIRYQYKIDSEEWVDSAEVEIDYHFDGTVTFRTADEAGNYSEPTEPIKVVVDRIAPDAPTITADDDYKAGVWVNKDVTLRFASTDNITTTENLRYVTHNSNEKDVTKWTNIENPNTYKTNTNKNVYVRAVDEAGNYSEPSEFFQVKVDITNPKTPKVNMNDYVEGISTKNKVTLKAHGSEEQNNDGVQITTESLIRYQYKIDSGEWADSAEVEIDCHFDGTVTFRTADEAGNYSEPTEPIKVVVDRIAPDAPTITADDDYKAGVWVNKDVTLRFASTDNITTTENLRYVTHNSNEKDVTKWTNIENPNTYKTNTNKNVYVRAVDEAGNYSEPSEFFQVKVDITNPKTPKVNMNDYVEGISTKNKVTLKAHGSEEQNNDGVQITTESLIRYQYKIDSGEWADSAEVEIDCHFDGTVTFRTADEAGNYSEPTEPIKVVVDRIAPDAPTITADDDYKAGVWVNKDVTLRFASTDNITTTENLRYVTHNSNEKDVTKWTNIENPNTYKTNTNKNVYVRAVDEAGNYSEPSEFFQVKVDITNPKTPKVNMNDYVEGISTKNKVTLKAHGSEEQNNDGVQITTESLIRYQYKIDSGEWADSAEVEIDCHFDGTVTFRTADEAGNYSGEKSVNVIIDKTPPTVDVTYSPEGFTNQNVEVTLKFSEEIKLISGWTQDESDKTIWTKTYSQNGEETVNFEDLAGNPGLPTEIKVYNIDKIGPTAVISKSSVNDKGNVVATLEASEPIQIDGWTRKEGSANTFTQEFTQDVDYIVEFKDLVGNPGEVHLVIDNINPKYTNINYYQIGGLHYATITFDQLVTPPGPWWFRALDSERVRYDGVRHGNKWYTSSFTSYELTFKNRYGKTVTVPINSALNQSNASIETESNSILSTGEGNINFPPAQSRSFSRENFSETDSVVDDQNQISAGETETTIEEETPVTDEETSTNDFSTIPEEKTLFAEIIEEADIKSDESEVIETTEENI